MRIEESPRVVYDNPPLVEVVCQLRFPKLERFEDEFPEEFQDAIRTDFPKMKPRPLAKPVQVPQSQFQNVGGEIRLVPSGDYTLVYDFISENEKWVVTLAPGFLALTTTDYHKWDGFLETLQVPFKSLMNSYYPEHFLRIGLRYKNVIVRSKLGLENVPWKELLAPHVLGDLGLSDKDGEVSEFLSIATFKLPRSEGEVRVVRSFVKQIDNEDELTEVAFLIDNDFFCKEVQINDAEHVLIALNRESGNVFRYAISEELHTAMGPKTIFE